MTSSCLCCCPSPEKYAGNWILGAGPVALFPTATDDALGSDQFGLGPAVVLGYKTQIIYGHTLPELLLESRVTRPA